MKIDHEAQACQPSPLNPKGFNPRAELPHGCSIGHVRKSMNDFIDFLGFINEQLHSRGIIRLESMLMPANFSSVVGEFLASNIPRYCPTLVRNQYHNGHPDLIPASRFPGDAVQHTREGIEVKASRYLRGWQGHNPENCFLLVFVFDSNRPSDSSKEVEPIQFRFVAALGRA